MKKIAVFLFIITAIIISILALAYLKVFQIEPSAEGVYQGYIEGDYLYISSSVGGKVVNLAVEKGGSVTSGALLFELDPEPYGDSYREAQSLYQAAMARHKDLTKGLRPQELVALEASIEELRVTYVYSKNKFERAKNLYEKKVISKDKFEVAQSAFERDRARLEELKAKFETAKLGARDDQVEAAKQDVERAKAALDKAQWYLAQTKGISPGSARVVDVLYGEGEFAPAGVPVVSLLPPESVKVRFFVPEPMLSSIKTGQNVDIERDGTEQVLTGKISYIAPYAEYTPPLIYSKENREKLVFMVEASFNHTAAEDLNPGQPVEVSISK
ncbi:HlyD family efflux transporter periplasmic adaptor subunit [bacterium]|nr:HlyD family efflux transporter periplasmic adaptor subunit [bacterium]